MNGSIIRGNKILGIISAIVEISADTTPTRYFIPNLSKDQLQQPLPNTPQIHRELAKVHARVTDSDAKYQHNEQARAALIFSSKKPTRQDGRKPEAPQPEEQEHTQDETSTPRQQGSWPRLCAVFVRGQN